MRWETNAPQSCQPSISTPQTRRIPASSCTFLQLRWGGRDAWPPPSSLPGPQRTLRPRQPVLTSWAGSPGQRLHRRPCAAAPVPAPRPPAPPWQPGRWHWLPVCGCRAQRGLVKKGSLPGFLHQLPLLLHSLMLDCIPSGNTVKETHISLGPPASPKDRGALGRAEALCSNWTSKGKTLIPKMLLNHIQLHPQRQLRTTLQGSKDSPAAASSPAPRLADVNQNPP